MRELILRKSAALIRDEDFPLRKAHGETPEFKCKAVVRFIDGVAPDGPLQGRTKAVFFLRAEPEFRRPDTVLQQEQVGKIPYKARFFGLDGPIQLLPFLDVEAVIKVSFRPSPGADLCDSAPADGAAFHNFAVVPDARLCAEHILRLVKGHIADRKITVLQALCRDVIKAVLPANIQLPRAAHSTHQYIPHGPVHCFQLRFQFLHLARPLLCFILLYRLFCREARCR